jgi:hypothetical protein
MNKVSKEYIGDMDNLIQVIEKVENFEKQKAFIHK